MTVSNYILALLDQFVQCFTQPGFAHFVHFILAHATLLGRPHCLSETLRATQWHHQVHWTTPYAFMSHGSWSCQKLSRALLALLRRQLQLVGELIVVLDDTVVKKIGRAFFGLGLYPDATDKNPGASRRKVWGHGWVLAALLWEKAPGKWLAFPLGALLFVPLGACPKGWPFASKVELARWLLRRLGLAGLRLTVVADNLYAKSALMALEGVRLVSRLKANAALYQLPTPRPKGQRGGPKKRGAQLSAAQLWQGGQQRRRLKVRLYGRERLVEAFVGVLMPSRTLGSRPILVVICPQPHGAKLNVFFSNDLELEPQRLLELYGARFKIEDIFGELKHWGGMGDYRQRSFTAMKRHVTLSLVAYSLLRLASVKLKGVQGLETQPWWAPEGVPSVTRLRRACARVLTIPGGLVQKLKDARNRAPRPEDQSTSPPDQAQAA